MSEAAFTHIKDLVMAQEKNILIITNVFTLIRETRFEELLQGLKKDKNLAFIYQGKHSLQIIHLNRKNDGLHHYFAFFESPSLYDNRETKRDYAFTASKIIRKLHSKFIPSPTGDVRDMSRDIYINAHFEYSSIYQELCKDKIEEQLIADARGDIILQKGHPYLDYMVKNIYSRNLNIQHYVLYLLQEYETLGMPIYSINHDFIN